MNLKQRRTIAIILSIATLIVNLFPISNGQGEVIITPMVENAIAATATPTPSPIPSVDQYYMVVDANRYASGAQIQMKSSSMSLSITSKDYTTPVGASIQWLAYDENVLNVEFDENNLFEATVYAVGPGYAQLGAIITYDGISYQVYCQIYVPLELHETANISDGYYGMQTQIQITDANKRTLQLKGPEASNYKHYLVKLKYVNYASGVTNDTTSGVIFKDNKAPSLRWESSNTNVVTVDNNGIITAVGSGYSEITVTTNTLSEAGKSATLTFSVLVSPTGYIGEIADYQNKFTYISNSSTVTIQTNALKADDLVWTIHKNSITGDKINLDKNNFMDVYLSTVSGTATLSNVKAGVYYITARPSDKYQEDNAKVQGLDITLIVPVFLPAGPLYMNVGDYYDILKNANLPSLGYFTFSSTQPNYVSVTANSGVVTALASNPAGSISPTAKILMVYQGGLFGLDDAIYAKNTEIDVYVIDGISLNTSNASIYTGSTLQLVLNTSNNYSSITWVSSNPSVAKVSEEGLVTGVAVGSADITVSQTINGITKSAKCRILVKQSVTKIILEPANASVAVDSFLTINANITPKVNNVSLKWVSSDEKILKISQMGDLSATVLGVSGGTAVVMAINQDNVVVGSCLVNVYQAITKITLSETLITAPLSSGWFQLFATITPESAKDQDVVWMSTDTSVITVDEKGRVTLKKPGKAAIMVTSKVNANIFAICNVVVTKSASGITLEQTSKNMFVGESFKMGYTISPADANSNAVVWTSSNSSVASVNAQGLISARAVGQAVILVRTVDGGYTATCTITVGRKATSVKLDVTKLTLNVGDYYDFQATLTPKDSTEASLTWESSDKAVAVISKSGRITAKKAGTTVITVKTVTGTSATCTVVVLQGTTGIKMNKETATINMGDRLELTATVLPAGANDGVTWKSSNTGVATVDKYGVVKGISGGVVIITATANDGGHIATCIVTVKELVTEVALNKSYYKLGLGKTYRLIATVTGVNASNQKLRWTSSNNKVVTVDANGRIKGITLGTATITVRALDGSGAMDTCTVRVTRLVTSISLNVSYITIVQGKSYKVSAKVNPSNATYKVPLWSSSKTDVATVSKTGVVTALTPGDTVVRARANDSSGVSAIVYVKVIAPVPSTGITASESEVVMSPGETKTVAISIVPNNSTDTYTWSSDNELVASVDKKNGKITAKSIGSANITIMTESGRRSTIKVYVVGLSRKSITLEQYTSLLLNLEVDGAGSSGVKVRWDVDDQEIATVINGRVTGKKVGTTKVHAVVNGRRLSCTVEVIKIR